jgi:hypothetical protein
LLLIQTSQQIFVRKASSRGHEDCAGLKCLPAEPQAPNWVICVLLCASAPCDRLAYVSSDQRVRAERGRFIRCRCQPRGRDGVYLWPQASEAKSSLARPRDSGTADKYAAQPTRPPTTGRQDRQLHRIPARISALLQRPCIPIPPAPIFRRRVKKGPENPIYIVCEQDGGTRY